MSRESVQFVEIAKETFEKIKHQEIDHRLYCESEMCGETKSHQLSVYGDWRYYTCATCRTTKVFKVR